MLSPIGRILYQSNHPGSNLVVLYYNSFSRADALLLGAAVALWLRSSAPAAHILRRIAVAALLLGPSLLIGLRLMEKTAAISPIEDPMVLTVGISLVNIASAGLLLLALEPKSMLVSFLTIRPLVFIGRISYGLYLFNELLYEELIGHLSFPSRLGHYLFYRSASGSFCYLPSCLSALSNHPSYE